MAAPILCSQARRVERHRDHGRRPRHVFRFARSHALPKQLATRQRRPTRQHRLREAHHRHVCCTRCCYSPRNTLVRIHSLLGQRTVVIATGIGPVVAALCTLELLVCGRWIKEIVYVGTSGWSPQLGGVLSTEPYPGQSTGCSAPNPSSTPNRVGDLCISPLAVNWACKKADYLQQCNGGRTLCTLPQETDGPSASELYGQCEFTTHTAGEEALTAELQAAAQAAVEEGVMPVRDAETMAWERSYWDGMSNGTGVAYRYDAEAPPAVFKERQCVEVDG